MPFPALPDDDLRAFLSACQADPDDLSPRLVFADWLDEHGDPRGEPIRWSVERDRDWQSRIWRADLVVQHREWMETHTANWPGGLPGPARWGWGLLQLQIKPTQIADLAQRPCWNEGWIGLVRIDMIDRQSLRWLAQGPGRLMISATAFIRDQDLEPLTELSNLAGLDLSYAEVLTDVAGPTLARLTQLRKLSLLACRHLTSGGLAGLSRLNELRELDLRSTPAAEDQSFVASLRAALPACQITI